VTVRLSRVFTGYKASFASGCVLRQIHLCLSVRPSVRHTPVLCQNEGTQRRAVLVTVG